MQKYTCEAADHTISTILRAEQYDGSQKRLRNVRHGYISSVVIKCPTCTTSVDGLKACLMRVSASRAVHFLVLKQFHMYRTVLYMKLCTVPSHMRTCQLCSLMLAFEPPMVAPSSLAELHNWNEVQMIRRENGLRSGLAMQSIVPKIGLTSRQWGDESPINFLSEARWKRSRRALYEIQRLT